MVRTNINDNQFHMSNFFAQVILNRPNEHVILADL